MRKLCLLLSFMTSALFTVAQDVTVSGKVTNPSTGKGIEGISVQVKGTKKGTSTSTDGFYSLVAPANGTLLFTGIGFAPLEQAIKGQSALDVSLSESASELNSVVVTALGIKKSRKALGYSTTEVKGSELTQAREVNVANALVGKVAGVNASPVSGGPGASANIIIRGVSGLSGPAQPLYVINGVPMTNATTGNSGGQYDNDPDRGDGIGNINPDDIESINVLKGASASALYGSRAKAGVIIITTKSGSGKGTLEFNSNATFDKIVNVTDWQYDYGNGTNGNKPTTTAAAYDGGNSSWGAKLDGSNVTQFDGVSRPYVAQKDNLKNFYRTGSTLTNTLAFGKGFDGGNIRFSASALNNESPVPNSGLDRYTFNFGSNFTVVKGLVIDARANYINDNAKNRPILADGAGNANFQAMFLPTSLDINTLKPGYKENGDELQFTNNSYATNPWFATSKFINNTSRSRLIGSVSARYTLESGYFLQVRIGQDSYNDRYTGVVPNGAGYYDAAGSNIREQYSKVTELNTDFLLGKNFTVNKDLSINAAVGGNLLKARAEETTESGVGFVVPFVYNILNAKNKSIGYTDVKSEVQSLYGTLDISYKDFLYLNASGRNDWFSTLAPSNNLDIFYPSVNASFVFSQFLKPGIISFGKIRAGWANVGAAVDPYQTLLSYRLNSSQLNGAPLGQIGNDDDDRSIPNSALKPSNAEEFEIGTEMRFLKNRFGIDFAWYNKVSKNEIVSAPVSSTSGYDGVFLNVGKLRNRGIELLVNGDVIKNGGFTWNASFNMAINKNKVLELADGQSDLAVATSRTGNGFTRQIVGLPANQIMAFDYKYDDAGKIEYDADGIPIQGDIKAYGSAYHKFTGGLNNEFSYKGFNFSFLIDGKFGGKVFSATDYYGYVFGLQKATLVNRETGFGALTAQNYYNPLADRISSLFVYDASFIKLRQVQLGYTFSTSMFNNKIKGLGLSVVGRNLFLLMRKTDNIDPEASYGAISQGLELGGVPPVRSIGLNLNVKF